MARPPIGPLSMERTVKFRLRDDEYAMLERIAGDANLSAALRNLIHDEYGRIKKDGKR